MVVSILPSNAELCWDYFAIQTVSTITLSSSSNVKIVEWLVSVSTVRLFVGSALTISFALACRGYTFDRSTFMYFFKTFRVYVQVSV